MDRLAGLFDVGDEGVERSAAPELRFIDRRARMAEQGDAVAADRAETVDRTAEVEQGVDARRDIDGRGIVVPALPAGARCDAGVACGAPDAGFPSSR